jgi:RNA-directed DNA polymerase
MSAHSNCADKLWKTKLQRIQNRSAEQHEAVFNNIGHILSEEMLTDIFHGSRSKAVGIDGMTKGEYGENLNFYIAKLLRSIRNGSYRPQPSRVVEIPKSGGGTRPLAISCFEDKLVQSATKKILEALYEPLFKDSSHGFRPERSCHTAVRELSSKLYSTFNGAVVEIDLRKCFDSIPHDKLFEVIEAKIKDKRFLNLLKVLVRAPSIAADGKIGLNKLGCPQGSILSPLLCNIYLDVILDRWFEGIQSYFKGSRQSQIRYCDDVVWVFERHDDAEKFFTVLPKRLLKYGLHVGT